MTPYGVGDIGQTVSGNGLTTPRHCLNQRWFTIISKRNAKILRKVINQTTMADSPNHTAVKI